MANSGVNSSAPTTAQVFGGVYNALAPTLVDGQAAALQFDVNGNLKVATSGGGGTTNVNITGILGTAPGVTNALFVELSDGTNPLGTNANPIRISPASGAATQPVSGTVTLGAGSAIAGKFGIDQTTPGTTNGVQVLTALPAGSNVIGHVIIDSGSTTVVTGSVAVTNVGTFAVQATLAAETTKVIGTVRNLGNAGAIYDGATAATAPANAVQQGVRGTTALPAAVTDGQLVAPMTDKYGRQVTVNATVRDLVGTASVNASAASGTALIASGGAGVFTDIITLIITNETATATIVSLTDGTATYKFALAANGGIVINFPTPLPATSSATAWTCGNSATVALDYVAVYAKNK